MGEVFKVIHHLSHTEDELEYIDTPGLEQAPLEVSLLILNRLGGEGVGCQTLDERLIFYLGLDSFCFRRLLKDAKCFFCKEFLLHDIRFWPSLQTLALDNFLKHGMELYPSFL